MFIRRGGGGVDGDHLLVEVGPGGRLFHLGLEEGSGSHFYVDNIGVLEKGFKCILLSK